MKYSARFIHINRISGFIFQENSKRIIQESLIGKTKKNEKTTAIRRIALRETRVSLHQGTQLRAPSNPSDHLLHCYIMELRGAFECSLIILRDTYLIYNS